MRWAVGDASASTYLDRICFVSKSNPFMFVLKCTKVVNLVKFSQGAREISW